MRSAVELTFRVRQELANLNLWLNPPSSAAAPTAPFPQLPNPDRVAARLGSTSFAAEVEQLAEAILDHRIPVAGVQVDAGHRIDWRRDYHNQITSGTPYFRLVPYLEFSRVGNSRTIWELNRHQHLVVLAQAFLFTHRDHFLAEIQVQVESWLEDNPYMRGINWASALEVAFRALSWMWVYHLVGASLPDEFRKALASGLFRHGRYLEHNLSVYASPNTHLLGEAVSLHALGVLFPEFPGASRWKHEGASIVNEEMEAQVREDGSHFEQSSYYHMYALDFFLFHQILEPTSERFQSKLGRMADFLDALMGRSRILPLIGDDDGGRVFHPYGSCDQFARATVATCARLFQEDRWRYDEADCHEQAAWWLIPERGEKAVAPGPRVTSRLFRDSGLAVMTSDKLDVIVDTGPFGAGSGGHSHSDTLGVIVRAGSEQIFADCGTYTYLEDPALREWFRGSAAHNTVRINGQDQGLAAGPFRWAQRPQTHVLHWETSAERDVLEAVCEHEASGTFRHRRRVVLLKAHGDLQADVLVVRDDIEGPPGIHTIEQFWHTGEEPTNTTRSCVRIGAHSSLIISDNRAVELEAAWRSPRFGQKHPAVAVVVRAKSAVPLTMWTALVVGNCSPTAFETTEAGNHATLHLSDGLSVSVALDPVVGSSHAVNSNPTVDPTRAVV